MISVHLLIADIKISFVVYKMKVYTIDPTTVPDDLVHFFKTLFAPNLSDDYVSYYLDICRTFMNAVDSDDDYFILKLDSVLFEIEVNPEMLTGSTWVESLTGDDMSAAIYSKDFARLYLANVDVRAPHHILVKAMYKEYKTNKVAQDTFPLIGITKYLGPPMNEHNFLRGYQSTNIKFSDVMSDYETMSRMKSIVEDDFFTKYGLLINIKDYKYIKNTFELKKET